LLQKQKDYALQQRVTFTGELKDQELQNRYTQADVFVLASLHEGYGMVLSEAITYGLPIVCTNAGAMSDTVPSGAGILVAPNDAAALADALRRVISDPGLRKQLQSAAHKARESRRSWDQAARELSALLAGPSLSE
jgi:glycosyltransferase involved in cell wall biosynthesis